MAGEQAEGAGAEACICARNGLGKSYLHGWGGTLRAEDKWRWSKWAVPGLRAGRQGPVETAVLKVVVTPVCASEETTAALALVLTAPQTAAWNLTPPSHHAGEMTYSAGRAEYPGSGIRLDPVLAYDLELVTLPLSLIFLTCKRAKIAHSRSLLWRRIHPVNYSMICKSDGCFFWIWKMNAEPWELLLSGIK